jgi:acetyl-CoA C-acetyltransferase
VFRPVESGPEKDSAVTNVVISSAARTAIGSYGKSLKDIPPTDLGATAAVAAIERAGLEPDQIDHVVFGNVIHTEPADMYMARVVGMKAGIPKETPAFTVNRLCGTGVQAIVSAAQAIQSGDVDVALAGGAESMSRGPYWMPDARWGSKMGPAKMVDPVMGGLTDPFHEILMGVTAENLAERMAITRDEQDAFAVESHRRAAEAREAGRFDDEIVPVAVKVKRETVDFTRDEHIREDASLETMAKLPTVFKKEGGTVTAGNASGMNDAGAAVVLMSHEKAQELGAPVRARILSYASCGVDPEIMGIGPVPAVRKVLDRAGVKLEDIGVIELNEAFSAQALAVMKDLDLDPAKVNPNGGAVALGHPIGATGAAITAKALSEMERHDHKFGLVTLCIGGGQGIAMLLGRDM